MDTASEKVASSSDGFDHTISKAGFVLDERRRAALAEVDNAKFSYAHFMFTIPIFDCSSFHRRLFHVKVCCVAGVGFFTDA
jgi:MFS transporter, PHS family, inorganic phosphate transporter